MWELLTAEGAGAVTNWPDVALLALNVTQTTLLMVVARCTAITSRATSTPTASSSPSSTGAPTPPS